MCSRPRPSASRSALRFRRRRGLSVLSICLEAFRFDASGYRRRRKLIEGVTASFVRREGSSDAFLLACQGDRGFGHRCPWIRYHTGEGRRCCCDLRVDPGRAADQDGKQPCDATPIQQKPLSPAPACFQFEASIRLFPASQGSRGTIFSPFEFLVTGVCKADPKPFDGDPLRSLRHGCSGSLLQIHHSYQVNNFTILVYLHILIRLSVSKRDLGVLRLYNHFDHPEPCNVGSYAEPKRTQL